MKDEKLKFACSSCGLCCKKVGAVMEKVKKIESNDKWVQAFKDFPYKDRREAGFHLD